MSATSENSLVAFCAKHERRKREKETGRNLAARRIQVAGLCGNFNGDDTDELRSSSDGPLLTSIAEFVKSVQVNSQCKPPANKNLVCAEPARKAWAQQKCQVLLGPLFEDCHNEVDVQSYFKRFG